MAAPTLPSSGNTRHIKHTPVDVVCTWNLSDEDWEKVPLQERMYFNAARSFAWTDETKGRRVEVNEVTRLMKYFGKQQAFLGCKEGRPHPLSCVMEALVLHADDLDNKEQKYPRTCLLLESLQQTIKVCLTGKFPSPIDEEQNLLKDWAQAQCKELRTQATTLLQRINASSVAWTAESLFGPSLLDPTDHVTFYVDVGEHHHQEVLAIVNLLHGLHNNVTATIFLSQQTEHKSSSYQNRHITWISSKTSSRGGAAAQLTKKFLADVSDSQKREGALVIVHEGQGNGLHEEVLAMGEEAQAKARSSYPYRSATSVRFLTWNIRHGALGRLFKGMCPFGCGLSTNAAHMAKHRCPCCGEEPVLREQHIVRRCPICTPNQSVAVTYDDLHLIYCTKSKAKHEREHHTSCSECKKSFKHQPADFDSLGVKFECCAELVQGNVKGGICTSCTKAALEKHREKHILCSYCMWPQWCCLKKAEYRTHLSQRHPKEFKLMYPFSCGHCGESFETKDDKKKHKKTFPASS